MNDEPLLLRVPEVARMLDLSDSKVYEMCASGELPCLRFGKTIRVSRDDLRAWLDAQRASSAERAQLVGSGALLIRRS